MNTKDALMSLIGGWDAAHDKLFDAGWRWTLDGWVRPASKPKPLTTCIDARLAELKTFVDREVAYLEKYMDDKGNRDLYCYELGMLHAFREAKSKL